MLGSLFLYFYPLTALRPLTKRFSGTKGAVEFFTLNISAPFILIFYSEVHQRMPLNRYVAVIVAGVMCMTLLYLVDKNITKQKSQLMQSIKTIRPSVSRNIIMIVLFFGSIAFFCAGALYVGATYWNN